MSYNFSKHTISRPLSRSYVMICIILACALGTAFVSYVFSGSGLTTPEPVGAYLNGTFPINAPGSSNYEYQLAYPNLTFDRPMFLEAIPGTNRLVLGQRDGELFSFVDDSAISTSQVFLDLSTQTAGQIWDGGMMNITFHPEYGQAGSSNRGYVYLYYIYVNPGDPYPITAVNSGYPGTFNNVYLRLSRFTVQDGSISADPTSELVMFNVRLYNSTHRGGGLAFGSDGMLYLTIGEQHRQETAQRITDNFEGGIIRIDVDEDASKSHAPRRIMGVDAGSPDEISGVGYGIPNDNPFLDVGGSLFEEFFATGSRAPHRMTFDSMTNRFWIGEIGANTREEINVFDPSVETGINFEWPIKEGTFDFNLSQVAGPGTMKGPTLDFSRAEASAIIGGYVARSAELPALNGKFICGDYAKRTIFALTYVDSTGLSTKEVLLDFLPGNISSFGRDHQQNLYICTNLDGTNLYKIVPKIGTVVNPPALLSATGAFTNLATLNPAPGMVPYTMTEPFWSDRAVKQRWMVIPNDGTHNTAAEQVNFSENGVWDFPIGAVLIKHFDLPIDETNSTITRRLETRFSIKASNGNFYFLTYKWRADGSDADLLMAGQDEAYTITTSTGSYQQLWHYPSQSECFTCHNEASGGTLGPRTRYLNTSLTYPSTGITANQLVTLSHLGILDETILDVDVSGFLTHAPTTDTSASLDVRARSYPDLNCGYCHQPATGNRAVFDSRLSTSLYLSGYVSDQINEPVTGFPDEQIVFPGDTSKSILYQRIHTTVPGIKMPSIGRNLIDTVGAALIADWILDMDSSQTSCNPSNVALGKIATQSSTTNGKIADLAIDGNTDGAYHNGSVSQTSNEFRPWLEVDLGTAHEVKGVRIWNRTDCCSDRLKYFYVLVSDVPFVSQDLNTTLAQSGVTSVYYPEIAEEETYLDISTTARYVRLQLAGYGQIAIGELEILGCCPQGAVCNGLVNQSISFDPIADKQVNAAPFQLSASASSGLPVSYQVLSGPATLSNDSLILAGSTGTVVVEASQSGNSVYNPAPPDTQSFEVLPLGAATVEILSPFAGEFLSGDEIQVDLSSSGDLSEVDHIELSLDTQSPIVLAGLAGSHTFTGVSAGSHTITAQLIDTSGNPMSNPEAIATVNVDLTAFGFVTVGSASQSSPSTCYTLTDAGNQAGAAWYENQIDLSQAFQFSFTLDLGTTDKADGMAFVMQNATAGTSALGGLGGNLGVNSISPSFGVEFDVHKNGDDAMADDHLAIFANGNLVNPIQGPVCATSSCANVEDGTAHQVDIHWNPSTQVFDVYFGGELRISYTGDLVSTYFGGNSSVHFGFTAGTGGSFSNFGFCVNTLIFANLQANDDQAIYLGGGNVDIDVLANDSGDPALDSATVTITSGPSHGIVSVHPTTGLISYQHDGLGSVTDQFSYSVDNLVGETSNQATVSLSLLAGATVEILSPLSGEFLSGDAIQVDVSSSGDLSAVDHIEVSLDALSPIVVAGLAGSHTFTSVAPGSHTISAQLIDTAGNPMSNPEAIASVNVDLTAFGFVTGGSASQSTPSTCYTLTNAGNQAGAAWYESPIDLSQAFQFSFTVDLGTTDKADGMTFVIQNAPAATSALGGLGGNLGVNSISPSFGVEFDVHKNGDDAMADDHLAIFANGNLASPIQGPVCATSSCANVEDGTAHQVDIHWNPSTQVFDVYFGGELRISYTGDLINSYFGGNSSVYFGFTAGTGGSFSNFGFCVNTLTFANLQASDDQATYLDGGSVDIDVLANDGGDPALDPTTVIITSGPSHGTVSVHPTTGLITYQHDGLGSVADAFSYTVDNIVGETSNQATVSLTQLAGPTIEILSPLDGELITGNDIQVDISASGDLSAADHIEVSLDALSPVAIAGLIGSHTFTNVGLGAHILTAQLIDTAGNPLPNSEATSSISMNVVETGFTLVGDALNGSAGACYILTEDLGGKKGAAWYEDQIDLSLAFDLEFDIRLGDGNGGADGMAFVLQNDPAGSSALGIGGSGLAVSGLSPSFGVEFDTHKGGDDALSSDHLAIFANGNLVSPIVAPECIVSACTNVEDDSWHVARFIWNPVSQIFEVYVDGNLRTTYTGDIVSAYFGGNTMVYFGFTASTGGRHNQHEFCVSSLSFGNTSSRLKATNIPMEATVFPNPFENHFVLQIGNNPSEWVDIQVVDVLGQAVYTNRKRLENNQLKIVTPGLSTGIYFIQVRSGQEVTTLKVMKR